MAIDRSAVSKNAQALASRGQFDAAIAEWQKLLTKSPADAAILNTIGDLLVKRKAAPQAIGAYCKAAEIFRADKELLKAIAAYKKILKIDPNCAEIYRYLGDLNAERGLISSAVTDYSTLAELYVKEGKTPEALEVYQTVLRHDPANIQVQKRVQELSALKHAAPTSSPDTPAAQTPAGSPEGTQVPAKPASTPSGGMAEPEATLNLQGAAKPGASEKAQAAPKPGVAAKPGGTMKPSAASSVEGMLGEALEQINSGELDSADTILSQLLNQDPGNPQVCQLLARLHLKRGELWMALNEYEFLAGAAMRADDFNLAESLIQEYLEVESDCAPLLEMLGRVYEKRENPETAALHYKRAILLLLEHPDPDLPTLPAELYDTIKELVPTSPLVSELAALLEAAAAKASAMEESAVEPQPVETEQPADAPSLEPAPLSVRPEATSEEKTAPEDLGVVSQPVEPEQPVQESTPEEAQPEFRLAPISDEASATDPKEQPCEPTTSAPAAAAGSNGSVNRDQSEVHFTLGQAYKDMGLFAEAIEEFRQSLTASHLFLDSSLELATCLREQGMVRRAIAGLESAMGDPRCQGDQSVTIRYELGVLLEAEGLFDRAFGVLVTIPTFKDVAERLDRIRNDGPGPPPGSAATVKTATPPPVSPGKERKKRRVSYL